jgi:hypothetical protein
MNAQTLRKTIMDQMERLNDANMTPEKLNLEIAKSKAISELGQVVINLSKVENEFLKTTQTKDSKFFTSIEIPESTEKPKSNIVIPITAGGDGAKK